MSKIINWVVTFGGLYVLYQSGLLSQISGGLIPTPAPSTGGGGTTGGGSSSGGTVSSGGGTPVNPNTPPPGTLDTKTLVGQAAGGANQLFTFDQWNWFYERVRGIPGPDPSIYLSAQNRNKTLTLSEWWAFMQAAGLNGLGIVARVPGMSSYVPMRQLTPMNYRSLPPQGRTLPPGGTDMNGFGTWIY